MSRQPLWFLCLTTVSMLFTAPALCERALPPKLHVLRLELTPDVESLPELPAILSELSISGEAPLLTVLPAFPERLESLTLDLSRIPIATLPSFPSSLRRLEIADPLGNLVTVPSLPPKLDRLSIAAPPESAAVHWLRKPPNVSVLSIRVPEFEESLLGPLPKDLSEFEFDAAYTGVGQLPIVPSSVSRLRFILLASSVAQLPALPTRLSDLGIIEGSSLSAIPALPPSLERLTLWIDASDISNLPRFPSSLQRISLDLNLSSVRSIPRLPQGLKDFELRTDTEEHLQTLRSLPDSVTTLSVEYIGTALRLPKLPAKLYRFNITTYCRQVAPITFPETLSMLHVNVVGGAFDPSFLLPEQLQELVLQSQSDDEVALPRLPRSLRKLTIQGGVRLRATADLSALLSLRVALRTPPVALPILPRGLDDLHVRFSGPHRWTADLPEVRRSVVLLGSDWTAADSLKFSTVVELGFQLGDRRKGPPLEMPATVEKMYIETARVSRCFSDVILPETLQVLTVRPSPGDIGGIPNSETMFGAEE